MKTLDQNLDEDISELKRKAALAMIKGLKIEDKKVILHRIYPNTPKKEVKYYFYFDI